MVHLYKELHPTDHFEITLPHAISSNERQLLTLFYQPLTGAEPISLYLTLWAEAEANDSAEMTHYYLMNVLTMPLGRILEARIALEAIGLLRTYVKDIGGSRRFIYELARPLDAADFFKDPLLSMFLYSKIGEHAYRKLRQRFCKTTNKEGFAEVTRSFIDVYKPVHTNVPADFYEEQPKQAKQYPFYFEQFDFNLLQAGLSEQLVPSAALTTEAREVIAKLAFLYRLSPLDMQKVVVIALDEQMKLTEERLKKAAADYYKLTVSKEAPKLTKTFEQPAIAVAEEPSTKEQMLLHYFDTTPPLQVLKDINNGKEPLPSSVQLAEDLVLKYGMPIGVVNVLLEYVMLSTDMKLPQKYVERIADHWSRKNLTNAKQAMELARQERDKYAQWKNENATKNSIAPKPTSQQPRKSYPSRKNGREEQVPDWFYKRDEIQKQQKEAAATTEEALDFEQERLKILQKLGRQDGQVN